jgi:tRNA uridine 5-carboxymethylaminomethyl modification enzyme
VRATRAQADRQLYKQAIRRRLENPAEPRAVSAGSGDLLLEGERVVGVVTQSGIEFRARAIVLTVGTFLGGRIHVGLESHAGGRAGDPPSTILAARLRENLRVGRLKTGTPPRIDGRSIDFSVMREQHSDDPRPVFSYPRHAPSTRASCPATSRPPTSARTTSFARPPTARRCSPA